MRCRRGRQWRVNIDFNSCGGPGSIIEHRARFFDPLAGRGAAVVREHVRALDQHGLAAIDLRHGALHLAKALLDSVADRGIENEAAVERERDGVAGEIVFGGPESAGDHDDGNGAQSAPDRPGEALKIVADDVFRGDFDAEVVELLRDEERVGIDPFVRQHLRADGDDLGVHYGI